MEHQGLALARTKIKMELDIAKDSMEKLIIKHRPGF